MNRYALIVVAGAFIGTALSSPAFAAGDTISWNLTPSVRYEDNIGLAADSSSERDTVTMTAAAGLTWTPLQSTTDETAVSASLFFDGVQELEDLSNYGVKIGVSHMHQFGADFGAPWVKLSLEGVLREYEDSEPRDGYSAEARLGFGKRFGPKFEASLGAIYQMRESTDDNPEGTLIGTNSDEVFDQERAGGFIRLDYFAGPKTSLFVEYNYFSGDVTSTSNIANFANGLQFDRVRDFAFEEGASFLAYKIDADQNVYSIGLTQQLNERFSLDISSSFLDADAEAGNEYENFIVTAALSITF